MAWLILTRPKLHWFMVSFDTKNLERLLLDKPDFEATVEYHGLMPYNVQSAIRMISNSHDEVDMALMKAEFESKVDPSLN